MQVNSIAIEVYAVVWLEKKLPACTCLWNSEPEHAVLVASFHPLQHSLYVMNYLGGKFHGCQTVLCGPTCLPIVFHGEGLVVHSYTQHDRPGHQ